MRIPGIDPWLSDYIDRLTAERDALRAQVAELTGRPSGVHSPPCSP
jgi:hypothetical protein